MRKIMMGIAAGILWLLPRLNYGQDMLHGTVLDAGQNPLIGANVFWLNLEGGTATDIDGHFELVLAKLPHDLVITFVGYQSDTITVNTPDFLTITLEEGTTLEDVRVVHRRKPTEISVLNPLKVEQINEKELLKAACCNLSESFETNPSVDVAFSDGVTGTRQIQMLGLAGPYTQITRENMPFVRGLAAPYGLTFVPGTWVEGMQLTKGAGSVINGFESVAGQINIELRKPEDAERMYLNLYAGEGARIEANANLTQQITDQWASTLLLHGKTSRTRLDRNKDGFMDGAMGDQIIALNRWSYLDPNGIRLQFGINGTYIDNFGGQMTFDRGEHALSDHHWGMKLNIQRLEGWVKLGKVFESMPWRSWAIQLSGSTHEQDSYFGVRTYNARQHSLYSNLLYQSILGNTNHQILMGLSLQYDDYRETFETNPYDRVESVPGGFFEYTFGGHEKLSFVAGLRGDVHNLYGAFLTPRLHVRYGFSEQAVWRISVGRGLRSASILAENNGLMASARRFRIESGDEDLPFGLKPEIAWNSGTNFTYNFNWGQKAGVFTVDLYHTQFQNQVVIDLDRSAREVAFYNLKGKSFANSIQAQVDYELLPRFDLRFAYRFYDVRTTFDGVLREKPLVARHRLFLNLAYRTENNWNFDFTANWQGQKRIPTTDENPLEYRLPGNSPDFVLINGQVSKNWNKKLEIYLGVENAFNFIQDRPVLASDKPFSPYFDSSLAWGPVFGRNIYTGIRYRI